MLGFKLIDYFEKGLELNKIVLLLLLLRFLFFSDFFEFLNTLKTVKGLALTALSNANPYDLLEMLIARIPIDFNWNHQRNYN